LDHEYLPRPGSQFLWLYQSLKYIPGGLGSITGVVLPGMVLTVLIFLPWLKRSRLIGGSLLGAGVVVVLAMTTAAYLSDRKDQRTREQLSKQVAQEEAWRREPFEPARLTLAATSALTTSEAALGGPPVK
jgi:Cytochrome b(C-terminal)/b6/petD